MIWSQRNRYAPLLFAAALLALASCPSGDCTAADPKPGLSGAVWVEEGYTDNLRADRLLETDAFFTGLSGEAWWQRRKPRGWIPHRFGSRVDGRVYSKFSNYDYAEFGPSFGYDWDRLSTTVGYEYTPHRLRVDPSTAVPGYADEHDLDTEFRSKFGENKRWLAVLTVDSQWELYDKPESARTYFQEEIEAGLRCRASPRITPRASVRYRIRDADAANFDLEETGLLFGFDLNLPAGIRGILRYEKIWRNYLVDHDKASDGKRNNNFGREDDVDAFETGLDLPFPGLDQAQVELRYRHRDNASTREERSYKVNEAGLRLSYDFD